MKVFVLFTVFMHSDSIFNLLKKVKDGSFLLLCKTFVFVSFHFLSFLNLGAQIRCHQSWYTNIKSGLDQPLFFLKNLASYMLKFISAVYVSLVQHINEKLIIKGLTFCIKWHSMAQRCFEIAKILTSVTYALCFSFTSNSKFTPILANIIVCRHKVIYELTLCHFDWQLILHIICYI